MTSLSDLARQLRQAAIQHDHRRVLVLHGDAAACHEAAARTLDAAGIEPGDTVHLGDETDALPGESVPYQQAADLMGTTHEAIAYDAHTALEPNALGRTVGTVAAGGLYLLLAPPLPAWPDRRDTFDEHLAVPPFERDQVTGRFRRRLVETLYAHEGVAIVDADSGQIEDPGKADDPPPRTGGDPLAAMPHEALFPQAAYAACRTRDQAKALAALEALAEPGTATVVEADRGRGKTSAAGLAAGALIAEGARVVVTAPRFHNTADLFARARELLATLGIAFEEDRERHRLRTAPGGTLTYRPPAEALAAPGDVDAIIVDEAAGLPVALLAKALDADASLAFTTTVHGYEGAGRGFTVRFKDHLGDSDRAVRDIQMATPIRYAPGDPIEAWAARALMLDARPAVEALVTDADPDTVADRRLDPDELVEDERLLGEVVGLLVLAHYRTSPNDVARLLDAPNLTVRALTHEDHVVAVALLAQEGGLEEATRAGIYEGGQVAGNMIPEILTSQLRDPEGATPVGQRVMRIATHPSARSRGLGSRLLTEIRGEMGEEVDWIGTGYGATPELVRFWRTNGYATVHLSTRRNPRSGEHSVIMLDPTSETGTALLERSTRWFIDRIASVLTDALADVDPDVVRAALAATKTGIELDLTDRAWRHVAYAAYGQGSYDANPAPFRQLAIKILIEAPGTLGPDTERLLVAKVLQARPWPTVSTMLEHASVRQTKRALGRAYQTLLDRYGTELAHREAERLR